MAKINRNIQCFLNSGTVDMEKQHNYRILLKHNVIESIHPGFLDSNPQYIQQQTPVELWPIQYTMLSTVSTSTVDNYGPTQSTVDHLHYAPL